jgi:hypothetical protein
MSEVSISLGDVFDLPKSLSFPKVDLLSVDFNIKNDGVTDIYIDKNTDKLTLSNGENCELISRVFSEKGEIKLTERVVNEN